MADPEMDFQTPVAQDYVLRRRPEWPAPAVQSVGESKLIKPTRSAMDYAVRLLLRTPLPELLIDQRFEKLGGVPVRRGRRKYPEARQIAALEQNVLAISRRIGLLDSELNQAYKSARESMWEWFDLARRIHEVFGDPMSYLSRSSYTGEWPIGNLSVYISFKSGRPGSMTVRPECTRDALVYHAAQMVTAGTRPQPCESCKTPFLIGGPRERGKKKQGARFCSDQCRWDHNNARRKKN